MERWEYYLNLCSMYADRNWDRFFQQPERDKEFDCDYFKKDPENLISSLIHYSLGNASLTRSLVPNLNCLVWVVVDVVQFAFARLFKHGQFKKLQLVILPEVTISGSGNFIEELPNLCTELTNCYLSAIVGISVLEPVFSAALLSLSQLIELSSLPSQSHLESSTHFSGFGNWRRYTLVLSGEWAYRVPLKMENQLMRMISPTIASSCYKSMILMLDWGFSSYSQHNASHRHSCSC